MASTGEVRRVGRRPALDGLVVALVSAVLGLATLHIVHAPKANDPYLWFAAEDVESRPGTVMRDGIPRTTYATIPGVHDNPVNIEQFGLSHWSRGDVQIARRAADWLVANQKPDGTWTYDFDWYVQPRDETLRAPWISALAQGEALSLLARTWAATHDARYLNAGRAALRPFHIDVANGGVARTYRGHVWFEEYPTEKPTLVLNGFLSTLVGLHEWGAATGDVDAAALFARGESSAAALIPQFALGGRDSAYALAFRTLGGPPPIPVNTNGYALVQPRLVQAMADLTGRKVYAHYAQSWSQPLPGPLLPAWVLVLLAATGLGMAVTLATGRRSRQAVEPRLRAGGEVGARLRGQVDGGDRGRVGPRELAEAKHG